MVGAACFCEQVGCVGARVRGDVLVEPVAKVDVVLAFRVGCESAEDGGVVSMCRIVKAELQRGPRWFVKMDGKVVGIALRGRWCGLVDWSCE